MTTLTLFVSLALAQDPTAPAAEAAPPLADATPEAASALGALPAYVYTTESVALARWLGGDDASATVDAGRRIEVVLEDGDMVRVRSGTDFGWVHRDKLTTEAPEQP